MNKITKVRIALAHTAEMRSFDKEMSYYLICRFTRNVFELCSRRAYGFAASFQGNNLGEAFDPVSEKKEKAVKA